MKQTFLKYIGEGKKFLFVNDESLTGVYIKGGPVFPDHFDFYYVHEVGIPGDVFTAYECTEVIEVE